MISCISLLTLFTLITGLVASTRLLHYKVVCFFAISTHFGGVTLKLCIPISHPFLPHRTCNLCVSIQSTCVFSYSSLYAMASNYLLYNELLSNYYLFTLILPYDSDASSSGFPCLCSTFQSVFRFFLSFWHKANFLISLPQLHMEAFLQGSQIPSGEDSYLEKGSSCTNCF